MATLKNQLSQVSGLPALPGTVVRLIEALSGDELGADELEKVIRADEAVAAAVLSSANCAAMGQRSDRVFTLQESIARLGGRALQRICMSMSTYGVLEVGGSGYGLSRGELWRGSLCGALAAELIAKESGVVDPGQAFVVGLLRDIGKLAMDKICNSEDMRDAFMKENPGLDQLSIERTVFDMDHAELGGELALMWHLPEVTANAIRYHHAPPGDDHQDPLFDVVHCGDTLCCWLAVGVGLDGLSYELDERAAAVVGMDRERVECWLPELRVKYDQTIAEMTGAVGG